MGSGETETSATDTTFDQVDALNSEIGNLTGMVETIVSTGSTLATGTGWEGAARDKFESIWQGGGWGGGEGAADVTQALNTSVEVLNDLSGNANTSATNITETDASSGGDAIG